MRWAWISTHDYLDTSYLRVGEYCAVQVKLEKSFPMEGSASAAWAVLQDLKSVAECMPGAQITEQIDATRYKGQVSVKVGPVTAVFKGKIEIRGTSIEKRQVEIFGKGSDATGASAATMDLTASIRAAGEGRCELVGVAEVTVTGKMANFGGRMMTPVADQILQQFGANFTDRVLAMGSGAAAQQAAVKVAAQPEKINALALLWRVLISFTRNLFGAKKT